MKTFPRIARFALLTILAAAPAMALAVTVDAPSPTTRAEITADADQPEPMPNLSANAIWAGVMLIVIAAIFVAAACIGPIVRNEFPEVVPPSHSHDEPPGASGDRGADGGITPETYRT